MNFPLIFSKSFLFPLLIGLAMLPIPLLRDFHIESAMLVALGGCFWAAWRACSKSREVNDRERIVFIFQTVYLIGLPLLLYAFVTGCLSIHGLGFWVLYPIPSVLLGYSLGRLLCIWEITGRHWIAVAVLIFISGGILLIEFFTLPQVYFFNHVWGGWPGPIYDETVTVSRSLIFFRGLTLLWVGLLWWIPAFVQSSKAKAIVIVCSILLIIGYSLLAEAGIITPRSYLKQTLGGSIETAHFAIYYDNKHYSDNEINFIAKKHEFYYQRISDRLRIIRNEKSGKIESYLYAHPWQKKKLVGAKFTSYVPVWLKQDQLHIARQQLAGSLEHELVHVLAKQFGNRLFNASWSIGLIEGLAVAAAGGESGTTTIHQLVVAEKPYPRPAEMKRAISPLGFYSGRSAINYTETGSFVQYLLNEYPLENFKQAYRHGNIAEAYRDRAPFDSLISGWHRVLDTVSVDSTDRRIAERLYSFPSLFEQQCPHVQTAFAQKWDQYRLYRAERDTAQMVQYLDAAFADAPENPRVKSRWSYLNLQTGNIQKVQQHASPGDTTAESLLLFADAFAMAGKRDEAQKYIVKAAQGLSENPDSTLAEALQVRQNSMQWHYYRKLIYRDETVSDSIFAGLHHRTQMRAIRQAIDRERWDKMLRYAQIAADFPKKPLYFDIYLVLIERLAYKKEIKLAELWLKNVGVLPLRNRYRERLNKTRAWVNYLK